MPAALASFGIAAEDSEELPWAAAVGAAQDMWRNTALEEAHAEGRIDDAQLLRANAATVKCARMRLSAGGTNWVLVARVVSSGARVLPGDRPLRELLGPHLEHVQQDASRAAHRLTTVQRAHGAVTALQVAAVLAFFSCARWHGMPRWPGVVAGFCAAVEDPADPHWEVLDREGGDGLASLGDARRTSRTSNRSASCRSLALTRFRPTRRRGACGRGSGSCRSGRHPERGRGRDTPAAAERASGRAR